MTVLLPAVAPPAHPTPGLPPWDYTMVVRQLKERVYVLRDRVEKLMRHEDDAHKAWSALVAEESALITSLATIRKLGGTAPQLEQRQVQVEQEVGPARELLDLLTKELTLVRASLSHAQLAHDNAHWLCFTEPELERFDAEYRREQ